MSELDSRADEPAGRSVVLSALRRSWVAIAAAAIVVGVLAYELSLLTPDRYEADSTVVLASTAVYNPLGEAQGGGDPERFLATQVSIAGSAGVLGDAATALGGGTTGADLADAVTFTPSTSSDAFTVTAAAETPDAAAARANAVVAAYAAQVQADVTAKTEAALAANTTATQAAAAAAVAGAPATDLDAAAAARAATSEGALQAGQITARSVAYGDNIIEASTATAPSDRTEPLPVRNGLIGAVLAALVAAAVAVWRRGRSREDVEGLVRGSGVPLIGVVPVGQRRDQPVAEALAPLVSLRYLSAGRKNGPVLVTGLQSGDATGEVALSLAAAAARDGRSALVLALAEDETGVISRSGLPVAPPVLRAGSAGRDALAPVPALSHLTGRASLALLDTALLHGDALTEVLDGLSADHDLVVVAAGPVARSPRAFAVLRGCATAIAVVRSDRPAAQLSAAWDELQDRLSVAGRALDGVVVTQKARRGRGGRSEGAGQATSQAAVAGRPAPQPKGPAAGGAQKPFPQSGS